MNWLEQTLDLGPAELFPVARETFGSAAEDGSLLAGGPPSVGLRT